MSEDDLRERWPNADRAGMIDDNGEVSGFDRTEDEEDEEDQDG